MSLSEICSVTITSETTGVRAAGFGVPLILSVNATFDERVRFYTKASDLLTDGFTATQPEYLAAAALLAQDNKVEQFALGRCALKPTQRYKVSVAAVTAGATYTLQVGADTVAVVPAGTFAVNDAIVQLIVDAITVLAPTGFTASSQGVIGAKYVQILANTAGNFLSVSTPDVAKLLVEQDHADPGVATDLAAIALEDSTWYGIINCFNSKLMATAVAAWVETNEKLFACASGDSVIITTAAGAATDLAKSLQTAAYARTAVLYHAIPDEFADAAWLGKCLPYDPGSETWKFKTLATVTADTLTSTQRTNCNNKGCTYYVTEAGINVTAGTPGGTVAAGEFIDVVRFRDWLKARIAESCFARLANTKKIPFTDAGIAIIEAEIRARLQEGIDNGGLSNNPAPTVTVPLASSVSAANKAARLLPDVEFNATLAGAIHKLTIEGVLSV